jgi:hypothetical protein
VAARVQARHATLLDEVAWRSLESCRDAAHYLAAARVTALADWVATVDVSEGAQGIERILRMRWSSYVREVAGWHPRGSREWIAWLEWLPGLGALGAMLRGEPPPRWVAADPAYARLHALLADGDAQALRRAGLNEVREAMRRGAEVRAVWHRHWRSLLQPGNEDTRRRVDELERVLDRHLQAMDHSGDGPDERRWLAGQLTFLFRRAETSPVATICHLGLQALQLERLRGGLLRRQLLLAAAEGVDP